MWLRRVLCLFLLLPLLPAAHAADRAKDLSPHYRKWIEEDVAYIIPSEERKQFLSLRSDAERDHFIHAFWEERNPDPGSGVNAYETEHYERLAYANEYFGSREAEDGWRTDRGRIYITLGAPKQKADYELGQNVRPMQIWFYQSLTSALPTHFYVVFFKPGPAEDWKLYSPVIDGPTKLVTTLRGMNDPQQCLDIVRHSLGDEVARTVVSLLPTAIVDLSHFTPDLESDALLGNIEGLADNPVTLRLLDERRTANVTSTIFYGGDEPDLQTTIAREQGSGMTVSYLFRLPKPDPSLVGSLPGGKFGYHVTLHTQVQTASGAPVYDDQQVLTEDLAPAQIRSAQSKIFGAEGRLPLAQGSYRVLVTLTNDLNHTGYRQQATVTIPSPDQASWGISGLVAFSSQPPVRNAQAVLPFSMEGIRFAPLGVKSAWLHQGETLRLAFQLWNKPLDAASQATLKVRLHYAWGAVGSGEPQQESEEVDGSEFSASGNLLTGHTFSTAALAPGTYRLVVTATNEATNQSAYAAMIFHVTDSAIPTEMWTVYDAPAPGKQEDARDDYQRGLSAAASGEIPAAIHWLRSALEAAPGDPHILAHLVQCYASAGQDSQIAVLSQQYTPTRDVDLHTAVLMALADAKQGDAKHAEQILEFEMQFQPPSHELYQALAETYQQLGETSKARELRDRIARL
ncbi:GWxTD domain-containing protein [Paracidobacterium acidisoli]|nr:GWxTD domain-containing protein [Paracidobacterium acidisoli]MBT9332602.1 GWxTD domain-containing protein [Paracidobacterium acidisoli]